LKKLVYSYLVYHADVNDTCRELTLLAINTFQKDLSNRNQLIRALALRIMCGIRVKDIIAIQVMTVKKAAFDTSPYVRKVACLCVPKVYALDASMVGELVEVVEKLLHDRSTMVLSSAIAAWREVCPARYDMLHSVYRKLVHTMADFDEWGQILALQTLTEYARTQFVDPRVGTDALRAAAAKRSTQKKSKKDKKKKKKGFYSDESSVTDSDADDGAAAATGGLVDDGDVSLDADHDLLLRASLPLLRSRSTAVVLQVAAVYSSLSPRSRETSIQVGEALTRCMRSHREVQYLLLGNIVTMAKTTPGMFRKYLKQFFIAESEPQFVKGMKVDILAALAAPDNAGLILKELTAYVKHDDKEFAVKAIRAAAAVGTAVPEVANRVLRGLMALVAAPQPDVVAHAVVAIRQLLQQKTTTGDGVILQLVGMLPQITTASARSSMVWLVGEFLHKPAVARVAPDTLRILAKGFREEQPSVKEQIVTLAAKLWAFLFLPRDSGVAVAATATPAAGTTDPAEAFKAMLGEDAAEADRRRRTVDALVKYVVELARNDTSYDLRDRVRLIKALLFTPPAALATAAAVDRALAVLTGQPPTGVQVAQSAADKAVAAASEAATPPAVPGSDADIPDISDASAPADGAASGGSDAGSEKAASDAASQSGSAHSADAAGSDAEKDNSDAEKEGGDTEKEGSDAGSDGEGAGHDDAASSGAASDAAPQEDTPTAAAAAGAGTSAESTPDKRKQDIADSETADLASGSTGAAAAAWGGAVEPSDKMRSAAAVQAAAGIIRSILLVHKPPPVLQSASASSDAFRLGSMSHSLGQSMHGYVPLPHWAEEPSDPDVRDPAKYEAAQAAKQAAARAAAAAAAEADSSDTEDDSDDDSASTASGSSSSSGSSGSGSTSAGSSSGSGSSGEESGSSGDSSSSDEE